MTSSSATSGRALLVGATGIVGQSLTAQQVESGWHTFGLSRSGGAGPSNASQVWLRLAAQRALVEPDLDRIASWWHTDRDLGRTIEAVTDMNKSRAAGFVNVRDTRDSFFHHVERYRAAKIIP